MITYVFLFERRTTMTRWDQLLTNTTLVTMENSTYSIIEKAALAIEKGKIAWLGPILELPIHMADHAKETLDYSGHCVTPGLIDCHTHLVYAGNRANEFEMRLNGESYEAIAKAGGGIQSTVNAVRQTPEPFLLEQSLARAKAMQAQGVTTVEIKSGYGLDFENEIKMLRVAKSIGETLKLDIHPTFLGAHALPKEFKDNPDGYIDLVCDKILPAVAEKKLATAVDAFCETIGFTPEQVDKVFKTAQALGLNIRIHAEQLSNQGGAALAAKYQALSADHLEYIDEASVVKMAEANMTAVLLPGAFYFLRETKKPPIDLFRKHQVPIAIATDCNPGTSPTTSLPLMMNMACTLWEMTPEEALCGVTINAAKALGIESSQGSLKVGKAAKLAIWQIEHPAQLSYQFGSSLLKQLIL